MTLDGIRNKIKEGRYGFSDHAVKRMIKRSISRQEVETVIGEGEIIEEYPPMTSTLRVVLFMGRRKQEEICISKSRYPRLWLSSRLMNPIQRNGKTAGTGGD
jgi:Domain of unknown function (DUF4258)